MLPTGEAGEEKSPPQQLKWCCNQIDSGLQAQNGIHYVPKLAVLGRVSAGQMIPYEMSMMTAELSPIHAQSQGLLAVCRGRPL